MESAQEFGPDTDAINRWLSQRETYASGGGRHRGDASLPQPPPAPAPAPAPAPDSRRADRAVLEALATDSPADTTEPEQVTPVEQPPARSTDVYFAPRTAIRRALGVVLLVTLALTAAATYFAATEPSTGSIGIAGTLGLLVLVVWAVRAGTTATHAALRKGQLELRRGGGLEVVDLASPFTPIAVVGTPGSRGWHVLVQRPDVPLLRIDASLVDPASFTEALLLLRPDLREVSEPRPAAAER